jgi:uncharacterized protein YjlB
MVLKDQIKNYAKKLVEARPDAAALRGLVRAREPLAISLGDDGIVPNNPRLPMLVYRGAVIFSGNQFAAETIMDALFELNGWGRSWRGSIYDFVHYHSQIHEALGVARGSATVEFGGVKGRELRLKAGDVAVLPSGTGHRLIKSSRNFLVVGAYPPDGTYDECTDTRDRVNAARRIARVRKPKADPVFGRRGPLTTLWAGAKMRPRPRPR